jgi:glycosyltransferase involved in cell wall biosynthesis
MKISYAIPVCNERKEIEKLVSFLSQHKRKEDEIIVLFDGVSGTPEVEYYLSSQDISSHKGSIRYFKEPFKGNFAVHKNFLTECCEGEWIFQIDADEIPHKHLIQNIHLILQDNPNTELYLVPRINTVEGLTQEHINKWGWRVNEKGWINFPDSQTRIYQKSPKIQWAGKVHEVITGHQTYASLPNEEEWCLYHPKEIKRQEAQNRFYESLGEIPYAVGDGIDSRVK